MEPIEEDEARKGWTDHIIMNFTSVWKQDTRIQKFEADGSQRDGGSAYVDLWDSVVWKVEMYVRYGLHLSGKGAAVFAEGLSGQLPVAWLKYEI